MHQANLIAVCLTLTLPRLMHPAVADAMPTVHVSDDKQSFVLHPTGKQFVPWGFNYDHDRDGRLLEDYWDKEWKTIEADFAEMKQLGANVVRIHLQFGKFMKDAKTPIPASLRRLDNLINLAEDTGLYVDLTGLGCYHKNDVPAWYDKLDEAERWGAQAAFWEAVARICKHNPAIFCYDLMNEPVVPGGKGKRDDWLAGSFGGKHFVQFIALETNGRKRHDIAKAWIKQMVQAIRKHDKTHMITVGLVPWSVPKPGPKPGITSGFLPKHIHKDLDFIAIHIYPEKDKIEDALAIVKAFDVGKPIVIEETFPLKCGAKQHERFIDQSKAHVAGWIGFYWGKTRDELKQPKDIGEAITAQWLEMFQRKAEAMTTPAVKPSP